MRYGCLEMLEKHSEEVSVTNECKLKKRVYTGLNTAQDRRRKGRLPVWPIMVLQAY